MREPPSASPFLLLRFFRLGDGLKKKKNEKKEKSIRPMPKEKAIKFASSGESKWNRR